MKTLLAWGLVAGVCAARVASADTFAGPIEWEEARPPAPGTFLTLDRMGETTAFDFDLSFIGGFPEGSLLDSVVRVDLGARWRIGDWGVYGQFAWSHISWAVDRIPGTQFFLNDETATNDLELGGTYSLHLGANQIFLRMGVILPTASDLQFDANIGGSSVRWTDLASLIPGSLWLRPGISLRGAYGGDYSVFYQVDATVCIPFHTSDVYPEQDTIWVVNAAVGVGLERFELTAEVANAIADVTYHSVALTASYRLGDRGKFRPYLGVVLPFVPDADSQPHVISLGANGLW